MSDTTEKVFNDMSVDDVMKELLRNRNAILEEFSKAYLAESGLMPSQVELVCKKMPIVDGIIEEVYLFRRKDE